MSIVRVGSTQKFADNWAQAFGAKAKKAKNVEAKKAKPKKKHAAKKAKKK